MVGIHYPNHGCSRRHHTLDRSGRQATSTYPLDHPNARVALGNPPRLVCRAVTTVIIDDDRFPCDADKCLVQAVD